MLSLLAFPLEWVLQDCCFPETASPSGRGDHQLPVRLCDECSFFPSLTPRRGLPQAGKRGSTLEEGGEETPTRGGSLQGASLQYHELGRRLAPPAQPQIMIDSLFDGVDFTMNVTRARLEMYAHAVAVKSGCRDGMRRRLQEQVKAVLAAHGVELTSIEKMVVVGGR